jgi:hypothetical protein
VFLIDFNFTGKHMRIFLGLDDTDILGSPGTNQIAMALAVKLKEIRIETTMILRHQLWYDSCVPYTSKNGSASMQLECKVPIDFQTLAGFCKDFLLSHFVEGSDPGLCLATEDQAKSLISHGWRTTGEWVNPSEAIEKAKVSGCLLWSIAGRDHGIVGALAAVGLAASGEQGRVVFHQNGYGEIRGLISVEKLLEFGVLVIEESSQMLVSNGAVDLVKKLRPNIRKQKVVLYVEKGQEINSWVALKRN